MKGLLENDLEALEAISVLQNSIFAEAVAKLRKAESELGVSQEENEALRVRLKDAEDRLMEIELSFKQ